MRTGRGFERLVNFSDAVVAIAVTLLVLPLVEIPSELTESTSVLDILEDHQFQFLAFIISFLVIWSLWSAHHRIIEYFRAYDDRLMSLHMVWLLTIVALPFMTQLLSSDAAGRGAEPVYVGTLLISSLSLLGLQSRGRAKPELLHANRPEVQAWLAWPPNYFTPAVLLLSLVLVIVFPALGVWPLLLLILGGVYDRVVGKMRGLPRMPSD